MDISEQSVRKHHGQILGVGKQWKVEKVEVEHAARRLEAWVRRRSGRSLHCPECDRVCPGYDQLAQRTWRHLDACGYTTLLHASVPRCECPEHGMACGPWSGDCAAARARTCPILTWMSRASDATITRETLNKAGFEKAPCRSVGPKIFCRLFKAVFRLESDFVGAV